MRILLTGGGGMVGRHISESPETSRHQLFTPSSSELDLLDFECVDEWINSIQPDLIIHAAGYVGGIQANINEPVRFLIDNLEMGFNLIRASYKSGIKKFINLGSSCMYPRNGANPLREEMILKGELEPTNEAYALAKISVARLCAYIEKENTSFRYKTLIPCNIYGPYDKFDPSCAHMVPSIIHKLHLAKYNGLNTVDIWGDGVARREFMYAGDLAAAVWFAVDRYENIPLLMNIGCGSDLTVNEYYRVIASVIGYEGTFIHDLSKPVGMSQKLVSTERAKQLGWQSKVGLEEGIYKTYNYYLQEIRK